MNLNGSIEKQLTKNTLWEDDPIWNAKSDKVAFIRIFAYENAYNLLHGSDLFLMDADGTNEKRLTYNLEKSKGAKEVYESVDNPVFSPDGTKSPSRRTTRCSSVTSTIPTKSNWPKAL